MSTKKRIFLYGGSKGNRAYVFGAVRGDVLSILREKGVVSLEINQSGGWECGDIEFLREMPGLREFKVNSAVPIDLDPIRGLKRLESLSVFYDFDSVENLRVAELESLKQLEVGPCPDEIPDWYRKASLERLHLTGYPFHDFEQLVELQNLRELKVGDSKICSVEGLAKLPHLESVTFKANRALKSLDALIDCSNLRAVEFVDCPKIGTIDSLVSLGLLERVSLVNCGRIESIRGLEKLPNLSVFILIGNTRIMDGDLEGLFSISSKLKVLFGDRKSYSRRMSDFQRYVPPLPENYHEVQERIDHCIP